MPQLIQKGPTKIKIVPRDGELEITLNINITVDGQINASSNEADVTTLKEEKHIERTDHVIPDFTSGMKLNFGK
jgi:hypothetical protein